MEPPEWLVIDFERKPRWFKERQKSTPPAGDPRTVSIIVSERYREILSLAFRETALPESTPQSPPLTDP